MNSGDDAFLAPLAKNVVIGRDYGITKKHFCRFDPASLLVRQPFYCRFSL